MEHPVFKAMEKQIRFTNRLPYYIIFVALVWGITINLLIKYLVST